MPCLIRKLQEAWGPLVGIRIDGNGIGQTISSDVGGSNEVGPKRPPLKGEDELATDRSQCSVCDSGERVLSEECPEIIIIGSIYRGNASESQFCLCTVQFTERREGFSIDVKRWNMKSKSQRYYEQGHMYEGG
jgi:hypothetical protein